MFTEITGNTDLYAQAPCPCLIYCRQLCLESCVPREYPTVVVQSEDSIILREDVLIQS
jgi:hypothetical protein